MNLKTPPQPPAQPGPAQPSPASPGCWPPRPPPGRPRLRNMRHIVGQAGASVAGGVTACRTGRWGNQMLHPVSTPEAPRCTRGRDSRPLPPTEAARRRGRRQLPPAGWSLRATRAARPRALAASTQRVAVWCVAPSSTAAGILGPRITPWAVTVPENPYSAFGGPPTPRPVRQGSPLSSCHGLTPQPGTPSPGRPPGASRCGSAQA